MATDNKRLSTVASSPWRLYCHNADKLSNSLPKLRFSGRNDDEIRPPFMKIDVCSTAQGSAYVEINGSTKVLATVYGPKVDERDENKDILACYFKFATFSCVGNRRSHQPDKEERTYAKQLFHALSPAVRADSYKKSFIEVYVFVLENNGGVLAAAITCASLALVRARIEMFDMVLSVDACISQSSSGIIRILLDPDLNEENSSCGRVNIAVLPQLHQISGFSFYKCSLGDCSDVFSKVVDMAFGTGKKLLPLVYKCLSEPFQDSSSKDSLNI